MALLRELKELEDVVLVGYDNGMGQNKIYFVMNGEEYFIDFPSMVKEIDYETTDAIEIQGKNYSFTEGRIAAENGHNGKDDDIHKLLLAKGLYEVYKKTGKKIFDVVMNCSLDSYKDDRGNSVKEKMLEFETVKIKEKFKDEVELKINRLAILPEALVGGLLGKVKFKEEDVILNDIGTKNFTILQIIKAVPKYETSFATKHGMLKIYEDIADRTKDEGLSSASSVEMYLEKTANGTYDIVPEIDSKILKYLMETIFVEIDKKLSNLDMSRFTKLVFLGGGSVYLKRFLEAKYTEREIIFVENAYFANAKGLFKKGVRLFGYDPEKMKVLKPSKKGTKKTTKKTTTKKEEGTKEAGVK